MGLSLALDGLAIATEKVDVRTLPAAGVARSSNRNDTHKQANKGPSGAILRGSLCCGHTSKRARANGKKEGRTRSVLWYCGIRATGNGGISDQSSRECYEKTCTSKRKKLGEANIVRLCCGMRRVVRRRQTTAQ